MELTQKPPVVLTRDLWKQILEYTRPKKVWTIEFTFCPSTTIREILQSVINESLMWADRTRMFIEEIPSAKSKTDIIPKCIIHGFRGDNQEFCEIASIDKYGMQDFNRYIHISSIIRAEPTIFEELDTPLFFSKKGAEEHIKKIKDKYHGIEFCVKKQQLFE
jgi:hypothetical protein